MADKRQVTQPAVPQLSKFQLTLQANLAFWAILGLAGVAAFFACGAVWDPAVRSLETFLFLVLGGGFTLLSVMDYIHESGTDRRTE